MNLKSISIILLIILSLGIISNAFAQTDTREQQLKEAWDFAHWEGKNKLPTNGIDIYKINIPSLEDLIFVPDKKQYRINANSDQCDIIEYSGLWKKTENDYVRIYYYFAYTNAAAQRYLLDRYSFENEATIDFLIKYKDNPILVGDVSFASGGMFIRNNTIVAIAPSGELKNRCSQIAHEIDSVLMNQKRTKDTKLIRPKIVRVKDAPNIILEPLEDEQ